MYEFKRERFDKPFPAASGEKKLVKSQKWRCIVHHISFSTRLDSYAENERYLSINGETHLQGAPVLMVLLELPDGSACAANFEIVHNERHRLEHLHWIDETEKNSYADVTIGMYETTKDFRRAFNSETESWIAGERLKDTKPRYLVYIDIDELYLRRGSI